MIRRTWPSLLFSVLATGSVAADLPKGFIRLSELAPEIAQDIRYARTFNFTEGPVPGYENATCILTKATAEALIQVEERLARDGYGLVVFDCYRPVRAVEFFVSWAEAADQHSATSQRPGSDGDTLAEQKSAAEIFFPGLSRGDLIPQGYIARNSGHSIGHTVDVGLRLAGVPPLIPEFSSAADCTAAPPARRLETGLDLGTAFDCFSPLSATTARVSAEARKNRRILTDAMKSEGFRGYDAEWWHFRNSRDPARAPQNFPVK